MITLLRYFTPITIGCTLTIACQKQNIILKQDTTHFIHTSGSGFSRKASNSSQGGKTPEKSQEKTKASAPAQAGDKAHDAPLAKSNYPKNKTSSVPEEKNLKRCYKRFQAIRIG